jgi:hypothetical protein
MQVGSGKRKQDATDNDDVLVPAPPTQEKYNYGGLFMVHCCPQAFHPSFTCKMAVCPKCYTGDAGENDEGGTKRSRRGRNVRDTAANKSVAKSTMTNKKQGCCPHHIKEDVKDLKVESNIGYLKHKRNKVEERDNENIATNCFLCGILF